MSRLALRSLESVRSRQHDRATDAAFRDGYVARAEAALTRQPLAAPAAQPDPQPAVNGGAARERETKAPEPAPEPRPLRYEPETRRPEPYRTPPGHRTRIARGDFATPEEAREAADAWRAGATYVDYLAMGSGRDKEAGQ